MKPFKESKLGKFLSEKVPGVLDVVDDYFPPAKILTALVGKNLPTEDQLEFEKLLNEHEKEMYALQIQDRDSARKREIDINNSENAGWLSKNTGSVIALSYTAFNFIIYVLILLGHMSVTSEMAVLIVNSITNIAMLIVGYYYGSSERKAKDLRTLK